MFIARVEIFDRRRSEERKPTRPSARKHISAPPNAAGGVLFSSYKHATPNGVKPVTLFFTASAVGGIGLLVQTRREQEWMAVGVRRKAGGEQGFCPAPAVCLLLLV